MKPLASTSTFRRTAISATAPRAAQVPQEFVEVKDCLAPGIDRLLGYFGNARYVAFRYEPRAQDVIWHDERTFGIGTGGWQHFSDEVEPLSDLYGVNLGSDNRRAEHVLVCDRVRHIAYFAPQRTAEQFLATRRELLPG